MKRPNNKGCNMWCLRGFTIVELMIVVVIVAILASMAIPSFQSMIERRRLIGAAESVYSDLQFARSEAVKQSRDLKVTITPNDGLDWCLQVSKEPVIEEDEEEVLLTTCGDPELNIQMKNDESITVTLGRLRGAPLDNVIPPAIRFASPSGLELRVLIAPYIGRIRMCSPDGVGKVNGYPSC